MWSLCHGNVLDFLLSVLVGDDFRESNLQNAVVNLCCYAVAVDIIGQNIGLLVV